MKSSGNPTRLVVFLAFCLALLAPMATSAEEAGDPIAACLRVWGDHPFGKNPQFKTLATSVKVFGIGNSAVDTQPTQAPSLVLIHPIFNLMGAASADLLNPNGWYCLRTTVSILGPVKIRAHCKAQLAAITGGMVARGDNTENRAIKNLNVTVIGSVSIERPCN